MIPKRVSLPYPPEAEALKAINTRADIGGLESVSDQTLLSDLLREHEALAHRRELLEAQLTLTAAETICGLRDESQHVELYDGTLGVSVNFVRTFSPQVGQLQWLDNLQSNFPGPNESAGNVSGVRWGSGALIGDNLFITAGHCFDRSGGGWVRPKRNGVTISEAEIATLMRVNFDYQLNGETNQLRPGDSYPVERLLEFRLGQLDYAIVQLGANAQGEVAGRKYGTMTVADGDLTAEGAMLCVIQHPNGKPKMIEAGPLLRNEGGVVLYDDIDTLGGSSGSAVLNGESGEVIGVHTNGGCTAFSGANVGVAVGAIRRFSSIL
jgi:V8-like Glu-specific endopeptidase